jgi:hypothetical protein
MRPRFAFRAVTVVGVGSVALACFAGACGGSDTTGPVGDAAADEGGLGGDAASDGGARDDRAEPHGDSGSDGSTGSESGACTGPGQCDPTHPCLTPRQLCCPPIRPGECGFCGGSICPL